MSALLDGDHTRTPYLRIVDVLDTVEDEVLVGHPGEVDGLAVLVPERLRELKEDLVDGAKAHAVNGGELIVGQQRFEQGVGVFLEVAEGTGDEHVVRGDLDPLRGHHDDLGRRPITFLHFNGITDGTGRNFQ